MRAAQKRFAAALAVATLLGGTAFARTDVNIVIDVNGGAVLMNAARMADIRIAEELTGRLCTELGFGAYVYNEIVNFYLYELRRIEGERFAAGFYARFDARMRRILAERDYLRWRTNWYPARHVVYADIHRRPVHRTVVVQHRTPVRVERPAAQRAQVKMARPAERYEQGKVTRNTERREQVKVARGTTVRQPARSEKRQAQAKTARRQSRR